MIDRLPANSKNREHGLRSMLSVLHFYQLLVYDLAAGEECIGNFLSAPLKHISRKFPLP